MPDPTPPQGPAGGAGTSDLYTPQEFAGVMRRMHPELAQEPDDNRLTAAVLKVYPEFRAHVQDPASLPTYPVDSSYPVAQPPPLNQVILDARKPSSIGADPSMGGRRTPMPGQYGFETGPANIWAGIRRWSQHPFEPAAEETTQAMSDIRGGAMATAEPVMGLGAAVAPLETAAAMTVGTIAQNVIDKAGKWLGVPPPVRELASDLGALIAGGKAAHMVGEPPSIFRMPRRIPAEARFMAREDALTSQFGEAVRDKENLHAVEEQIARSHAAAAQADAAARQRTVSTIALKAAQKTHANGMAGAGPFAYLDTIQRVSGDLVKAGESVPPPVDLPALESLRRVPPVMGDASQGPPQLPEHAGPSTAIPQNFILAAEPGAPVESVGAGGPRIAQATPEGAFESQQLADLIDRTQNDYDRAALVAQQERYRQAHYEAAQDNAAEMEYHTYDPSGAVIETGNPGAPNAYRAVAGSSIYNRVIEPVVGKNPNSQPPRSLITALMRAYADTGARSSRELPKDYLPSTVKNPATLTDVERGYYTSRSFKFQYDRYIEHIINVADSRAQSRVAMPGTPPPGLEGFGAAPEAPGELPQAEGGSALGEGRPTPEGEAGPPPAVNEAVAGQSPPKAMVEDGEIPADWLGLPPPAESAKPTATFIGYQPTENGEPFALYNISGGPRDRSTVSAATLAKEGIEVPATPTLEEYQASRQAGRPPAPPPVRQTTPAPAPAPSAGGMRQPLTLNVAPDDVAGLRKWYHQQAAEYGSEPWHQQGLDQLAAGNADQAYHTATVAANRSADAILRGGQAARAREATPIPGVSGGDRQQTLVELAGPEALPKGATVTADGIVHIPDMPEGFNPTVNEVVLNTHAVKNLVDLVDPLTIARIENAEGKVPGNLPSHLRIYSQMADQILKTMPEEVLQPFLEAAGMNREEAATQLAQSASQAGKTLATFKHWQDAHWDEILHLNPELAGTRGPGAAGRLEFLPEERQAQVLAYLNELKSKGKATPEMQAALKEIGFELPKTIKPDTKESLTYTRRWLTKQRRLAEMAKTLDIAAASGDDFDRVAAASALGLTNERSTAGQIFDDVFGRARLSFMLSQASTAMKILESHGLRYNLGTLEEVLSGVASRLLGKHDQAAQHFSMARDMSTLKPGTFPTGLLRKPWTDNLGEMFNYTMESVSGLEENDRRRALSTLDQFPREEARMTGAALLGEQDSPTSKVPGVKWLVDPRVRNVLTVGIRSQAASIRSALYDATLRSHILAAGGEPADILGADNPGRALVERFGATQAEQMVGAGVASALNYSYAGRPLPDSLPGKVIDMMSSLPVVSTMLRMEWAFPRFQFATVPRWLWDRVPGTLILDMMAKKAANVGRLAKGAERVALERDIMPAQIRELNTARYDSAKALQDTMSARLESREAAQGLKAWQTKLEKGGMLPEVMQGMQAAAEHMQAQVEVATTAAQAHKAAEARVSDLLAQQKQSAGRVGQLQEIDAPSFEQALARQAVGVGLLMPLALAMRNSKGAEDTEYYQYKVGGKPLDMRPFLAGFGPFLLYADFFSDVAKKTDWSEVQKAHEGGADWGAAFGAGYQGKYTDRKLLADTMEAWLTIHPLFGTASYLMDALSGKQAEGSGSQLHGVLDEFLATTGQAIGSFFLPAQTVSDLAGSIRPEEAISRTPERPGQYTSAGAELTEPAQSHIPGAREQLPPRVSPFTGQPRETQHPALHQLLGTTFGPEATPVEQEITHTGLKLGLALPRVSGDAEFDNKVNTAYAQVLKENFGDLLKDPDYQRLPIPQRRDILENVFKGLKAAAYATVAEQVGAESAQQHLQPDKAAKYQRWGKMLEQWAKQDAPPVQEPPAEAEPAQAGIPPPAAP